VVITGCDSGFGLLIALKLSTLGFYVIATCLTDEGVAALKDKKLVNLFPVKCDVTLEADVSHLKLFTDNKLKETSTRLWAVINNAGVLYWF
jgi:NAD(P)-dependent dehydrogenase (short-subunit alcohol dehydrogenase family)